jgi:methyl-accepting chemotaxis protein
MTIRTKVFGGFCILILCIGIVTLTSVYRIGRINQTLASMDQEMLPRVLLNEKLGTGIVTKIRETRDFLLTGDLKYIDNYKRIDDVCLKWEEALCNDSHTEQGKQMTQAVEKLDRELNDIVVQKVIPLRQAGKNQEALRVLEEEVEPLAKELSDKINKAVSFREQEVGTQLSAAREMGQNTQMLVGAISVLAVIVGFGIIIFLSKSVVKPIRRVIKHLGMVAEGNYSIEISRSSLERTDEVGQMENSVSRTIENMRNLLQPLITSAEQLVASSRELSASSEEAAQASNQVATSITNIAYGADAQLFAVENTCSVVEKMTDSMQQMNANINHVADKSTQVAQKAKGSGISMGKAVEQMAMIEQTVNESAAVVGSLGGRSNEIGQIVETISGIARQTNLLALNAAIEAARAGEQGRGFAVVAEEVRKLAEQSQTAAKKIANLIKEIQEDTTKAVIAMNHGTQEVNLGTKVVNEAVGAFQEIEELVIQVSDQVAEVSCAMKQLGEKDQEIITSVTMINDLSKKAAEESQSVSAATEEQSAAVEEIAAASQTFANMAQNLQRMTTCFRI